MIAGNYWDELSASAKSEEFRAQQEDYVSLSFDTISASGPNAAIVHYIPSPDTNREIDDTSTYLLDSGAQYKGEGETGRKRVTERWILITVHQFCFVWCICVCGRKF